MRRFAGCCAILLALAVADGGWAGEAQGTPPASREDLDRARERIEAARARVNANRAALDAGQQRLRAAERAAGRLAGELRVLRRREAENAKTLKTVISARDELTRKIAAQGEALSRDIRAAWRLGRESPLRLWLSADDPSRAARTLRYFAYVQRDRQQRLAQYDRDRAALSGVEQQVAAEQERLRAARTELLAREKTLAGAREERRQAVLALAREMKSSESELRQRRQDEAALRQLFGRVREAFREVPAPAANGAPLAHRKGQLRWPAGGRLATRFGTPVAEGKLQLNGIVIAAAEGSAVRAVHAGRVVFADWMRGYGQLLILDHGEGFLTVYGYNEALSRQVGDWVQEGDTLASVGNSGGRSGAGLYFEIRQGGEPVDPARWLRR